jgi:hypothetical protein
MSNLIQKHKMALAVRNLAFAMQAVEREVFHCYCIDGFQAKLLKAFPAALSIRKRYYSRELFKLCAELENIDE